MPGIAACRRIDNEFQDSAASEADLSCKIQDAAADRVRASDRVYGSGIRTGLWEAGRFGSRADGLELKACCLHRGVHRGAGGEDVERATGLCRVASAWE